MHFDSPLEMKSFALLFMLMGVGVVDPIGDSVIYRTIQGLATLGILALVYKIATHVSTWEHRFKDGDKSLRKLTHRSDDHSKRLFEMDGKQEEPFNEYD